MEDSVKESKLFWNQQAAIESQKHIEFRYQYGEGPCNVFILDTSSSLGEHGFMQMKEAFLSIIDEYAKHPEMDENVAVIACGRETKFTRYFSNHYEDIKHCLDDLHFGGSSPLTAAFLLSKGCFVNGASHTRRVGDLYIHPRLILISDGRPTDFTSFSSSNDHSALESDETVLEFICNQSRGGKIVHSYEARQFAKLSQNMKIASRLSYTMMNDGNDRERVMTSLVCTFPDEEFTEMDQDDIFEVCLKKSLYRPVDRIEAEGGEDLNRFEERNPQMPPLGARVKRGRDWVWDDQDSLGPGTVIGHCKNMGWLTVEWDTGSRNIYRYGTTCLESDVYDVQVCNEPRILRNEPISTGCQVHRGPDWELKNQDGGTGSIGSVVTVVENGDILVRWQNGFLGQYRFGRNGKFDLRICDPFSPEAVRHRWELMRTPPAMNYTSGAQASPNEDFEKALDSSETSNNKTSPITTTNPILHVTKGKYFRNHSLSSDIETDGPSFSCALGQWFWKDGTGKWNPYCRETNTKINKCYKRDPKSTAIVTVQNQTYRVVMAKNIQIHVVTREKSEVKLVKK
ncbi:uncharacterized protein LOC128176508 isoform X2 [Crassostrea angulata]|uniref:uncharacterized protein LOC128176508 isoform X2 n=1 Tax=Magallana angulata TaxID=2784310 RepID=UPI0022B19744|nr:uncharacterized protein LOC128176508 isoform X2 [Crassostrea angulata]